MSPIPSRARLLLPAALATALFATAGTAAHPQDSGSAGDAAAARANARWDFYFEESRIDRLVDRLSRDRRPETAAITGVRLIAVTGGEALPGRPGRGPPGSPCRRLRPPHPPARRARRTSRDRPSPHPGRDRPDPGDAGRRPGEGAVGPG